jgi:hypothetical protein
MRRDGAHEGGVRAVPGALGGCPGLSTHDAQPSFGDAAFHVAAGWKDEGPTGGRRRWRGGWQVARASSSVARWCAAGADGHGDG